jgi:nicotinate phosphoribosyltransferase
VALASYRRDEIARGFGWGTRFGNDMGIPTTLSIVAKVTAVDGIAVAKLSDNPAKATGSRAEILRCMTEVGYNAAQYDFRECEV